MIYSKCLYLVLLRADDNVRTKCPVTRGDIVRFVAHACRHLQCELTKIRVGEGHVLLLINLNPNISIADLSQTIKRWTSSWIVGKATEKEGGTSNYWSPNDYFAAVSPEEKASIKQMLDDFLPNENLDKFSPILGLNSREHAPEQSTVCHHIILITSRARLLLPLKYRNILSDISNNVATNLGARVITSAAMRNHLHLLCHVPYSMSVNRFVHTLDPSLLEKMRANPHYREFDGWDKHAIAFTVSASKITSEEHDIFDQDRIHRRIRKANEMSYLYQRLNIPFLASLH